MREKSRRKSMAFFIVLGACLVSLAIALNVGWILLNLRQIALLVLGIITFGVIITGVVLNTTFLVREMRRNEKHDAFINAVTHDLKTPLASIRLYLETLKRRAVDEQKRAEFYDIMLADSERLLHTVEQVLQAGRAGHLGGSAGPVTINMDQLLNDSIALARVRYKLDESAIRYLAAVHESEPVVAGDVEELQTAILNIIDNAVKYSRADVRITVGLQVLENRVVVTVHDAGIGIPRAQLKRIFKRFYRAPDNTAARIRGTGLGLFIVKTIVQKHGGKVYAESIGEGAGSRFTMRLPRLRT